MRIGLHSSKIVGVGLLLMLGACDALSGCDPKAAKQMADKVERLDRTVGQLSEKVDNLTKRLEAAEARGKAEAGPTQAELGQAIDAIDAKSKPPGAFKLNYVLLESTKLGNGNWQVVFGKKDGTGPRVMVEVLKTATGWVWDGMPGTLR